MYTEFSSKRVRKEGGPAYTPVYKQNNQIDFVTNETFVKNYHVFLTKAQDLAAKNERSKQNEEHKGSTL